MDYFRPLPLIEEGDIIRLVIPYEGVDELYVATDDPWCAVSIEKHIEQQLEQILGQ